jgi:hypothetical protein
MMTKFTLIALVALALPAAAGAADKPKANVPTSSAQPRERVVCHIEPETGSLAKMVKRCATVREWDNHQAQTRELYIEEMGPKGNPSPNG